MQNEKRSDLGQTRLARPVGYIVFVVYLAAMGVLEWAPTGSLKAIGGIFLGFTAALLGGPLLSIWKVAYREETAGTSSPLKESSKEA